MPYLSPHVPRWTPSDEAALASAVNEGLLAESHYLDLKESVPPGASKNRELARDLASFAIDGGTLLVGIREHADRSPELVPVELAGLSERIEQVARSIPDPPIPVTCIAIESEENPGYGYLLIEVPATGTAPHMVDGAYMGRGDKTKHRLNDAEVLRLHQARERTGDMIASLVDDYVARDPLPTSPRRQAHLFVVAAPVSPRTEMLLHARPDGQWPPLLHQLLDKGAHRVGTPVAGESPFKPDLRSVGEFARRADGAALTYNLTKAREIGAYQSERFDEDAVEFEATEDGTLRVLHTRLSDHLEERGEVIFEDIAPYITRQTVGMASVVAELTGYLGPWMLGVAATGISGLTAYGSRHIYTSHLATLSAEHDQYRRYTTASGAELVQTPGRVTERLVGRYLRSLGMEDRPSIRPLITDASVG